MLRSSRLFATLAVTAALAGCGVSAPASDNAEQPVTGICNPGSPASWPAHGFCIWQPTCQTPGCGSIIELSTDKRVTPCSSAPLAQGQAEIYDAVDFGGVSMPPTVSCARVSAVDPVTGASAARVTMAYADMQLHGWFDDAVTPDGGVARQVRIRSLKVGADTLFINSDQPTMDPSGGCTIGDPNRCRGIYTGSTPWALDRWSHRRIGMSDSYELASFTLCRGTVCP
jgi:hypothetical protein